MLIWETGIEVSKYSLRDFTEMMGGGINILTSMRDILFVLC